MNYPRGRVEHLSKGIILSAENSVLPCDQKQVEEELQVAPDSDESSPKPPPPVNQDSPSTEGEAARFRIVLRLDLPERKRRQQEATRSAAINQQTLVVRAAAPGGKKQQPAVGRAPRMRVARVLHSILACRAADSVDAAALQPVALPRPSGAADDDDGWRDATLVCPSMDGCGIHMNRKARLRRAGGKDKAKREGRKRDGAIAAAHKPASLPLCSEAGMFSGGVAQ
ncbi:hypothetical protein D1007_20327 [Hordeum vulgare]|nr:hypothetical protein D1007_20327 [Hordeum vulgare]